MKRPKIPLSTRLRCAAIVPIAALLFLSVPGVSLAQTAPTIETIVTLPVATTENISEGPDGAIYITAPRDRIVWKVKNGKAEMFFTAPDLESISGVAGTNDELVIVAAAHSPFMARTDGQPGVVRNPNPKDPECRAIVLDKSGKVKLTVPSADPKPFFNGLARAGDNWFLATSGNAVYSIDTKAGKIEQWFQDPMVRTNGIKVHNGAVYLPSGNQVFRVQIGPDRKAGAAVMFAMGAQTDDFGIAPDGTLYIPSGKTIVKVTPSGQNSVFISDMGNENPAAAWVSNDGKWLFWPERNGPAKLKRVALK
jgi:streptogramin lyase